MNRRELLTELSRLHAKWVNGLVAGGAPSDEYGDVRATPAQEETYLGQVRKLLDQLRRDRPSLAAVTAEQFESFARAGLVMAFNPHQRRGPDGRWIKMDVSELKAPQRRSRRGRPHIDTPDAPATAHRSGAPSGGEATKTREAAPPALPPAPEPEILDAPTPPVGFKPRPDAEWALLQKRLGKRTPRLDPEGDLQPGDVVPTRDGKWTTVEGGPVRPRFWEGIVVNVRDDSKGYRHTEGINDIKHQIEQYAAERAWRDANAPQAGPAYAQANANLRPGEPQIQDDGRYARPTKQYATWGGKTYTRTSRNPYRYASVVASPKNPEGFVHSWHRTAAGAQRGTLEASQRGYFYVKDVVETGFEDPSKAVTAAAAASAAAATEAQRWLFEFAFNPHQRRGPDGRWIKGAADALSAPKTDKAAIEDWADRMRAEHPDLKLDIAQTGAGPVVLSRIELPKAGRGKGTGSAIMRSLTDLADERGITLALTPSGDFGGSVARLRRFYESFGFVRNKGRNRNYDTTEDYVRPPRGAVTAAATDAQRELFDLVFGFNPHQRRGPDGRWIRMPTSELKRPRRSGRGRARTRHVEFEHRDGKPVYKVGGRERNWTPAEARAIADALDATADGQSVDAPVRGRVVTDGVQRRTVEQVQPFRNNKGGVTLDVGRDRGKDGSGEVELTDAQARALARDLREAADRQEGHDRAAAAPASLDPPEYATQTPPVNLPDPAVAYQEALEEYNISNYNVAWTVRQRNRDARRPDAYLDLLMDEYDAAQGTGTKAEVADRIRGHLDVYYPQDALALDPKPDHTTYLTVPALPPGPRTTGGARPPVGAPIADRQTALDRSIRSGLNSQDTLSGGAIGDTRRVRLGDGTEAIYKRAKRVANGRTPEEQADAEELASLVAETIGVRAPATVRASPTEVYMEVMPGKSAMASGLRYADRDTIDSAEGAKLGLLDVLLNNGDRHTGNWMRDANGEIAAIDHGFAFDTGDEWQYSAFTPNFRNGWNPLTPSDIGHVAQQLSKIKPQFEAMGRGDWYRQMRLRLNQLDREARGLAPLYPAAVTAAQRLAFASRGTLMCGGMA